MTRSLLVTALSCALLLTGGTANAETATLKNPNWQEVPGTKPSGKSQPRTFPVGYGGKIFGSQLSGGAKAQGLRNILGILDRFEDSVDEVGGWH